MRAEDQTRSRLAKDDRFSDAFTPVRDKMKKFENKRAKRKKQIDGQPKRIISDTGEIRIYYPVVVKGLKDEKNKKPKRPGKEQATVDERGKDDVVNIKISYLERYARMA